MEEDNQHLQNVLSLAKSNNWKQLISTSKISYQVVFFFIKSNVSLYKSGRNVGFTYACFTEIGLGRKFFFIDLRPISTLLNRDSVDIFFISNSLLLIGCSNLIKTEMISHFDERPYTTSILCVHVELGSELFRNATTYLEQL